MKEIQLDENKLQELVEKYAMEGAEKAIKEFYTGYNSPYLKKMREHLESIAPNPRFDLPDITSAINTALSHRLQEITNEVVAKTYVKLFNRIFTHNEDAVVSTEDLFQQFGDYIKRREETEFDCEELDFDIREGYVKDLFQTLKFKYKDYTEFELTLLNDSKDENGNKLYIISRLPGSGPWNELKNKPMFAKITLDDGKQAEVPILDDVISNDFMAYCAKLMLSRTKVRLESYPQYHNYD